MMNNYKKTKIGNTVKVLRKNAGLTQRELAKKLDISDKAISKWERGLCYPDVTLISKLSKALDIDTDALFIEEDKHLASKWCGVICFEDISKNRYLTMKVRHTSIIDILICYFLLVGINKIVVFCDSKSMIKCQKSIEKYYHYNVTIECIDVDTIKQAFNSVESIRSSNSIMLIRAPFFVYGVGLTSTFQRAMMDNAPIITLSNPNLPVLFLEKRVLVDYFNTGNFTKSVSIHNMFRGYIKIDLVSNKRISECSNLIAIIEKLNSIKLYNPIDIIKLRNI